MDSVPAPRSAAQVLFRPLDSSCAADLARLFEQIRVSPGAEFFHPHPLDQAEAQRICGLSGKDYYCLAYLDETPVGYGMLRGWDAGYAEPSLGVALAPDFVGRGLGRALTTHLHTVAKERGTTSIRLKVYTRNQAGRALYLKLGYAFTPHADGEELGRLMLMPSMRVGILSSGLVHWAGGLDFLCGLINSLLAAPSAEKAELIVLLPTLPPRFWSKAGFKELEGRIQRLFRRRAGAKPPGLEAVRERLAAFGDRIRIHEIRSDAAAHADACRELKIDAVFPTMRPADFGAGCGMVGYLYDFQHRHLPGLFSAIERARRDRRFRDLVTNVPAVIVNARCVAKDIRTFIPEATAQVFALPFAPAARPEWLPRLEGKAAHYGLSGPYFIVCNQFWEHKDHRTAFRAFARIAASHPTVKLVCTGSTADSRSPGYFPSLEAELRQQGLEARVAILGLIPKRDQIELLKGAVALIQPTLFEGGPGGGAAYDAIGLDVPVIASDIPVNLEIDCGQVAFFPAGDAEALAVLMEGALRREHRRRDDQALLATAATKARQCGEVIWQALRAAQESRPGAEAHSS
jgi:glycosyltransferase involved in cell wall biosynthesis/ribosomal protein S18 acetylase RimI-like enzyme